MLRISSCIMLTVGFTISLTMMQGLSLAEESQSPTTAPAESPAESEEGASATASTDNLAVVRAQEEFLKTKGLTRSGDTFVLAAERDMAKGLAELRALKKKVDDTMRSQAALERRIRQAKAFIANSEFETKKLNEELAKTTNAGSQNRIIGQINALGMQTQEAVDFKAESERKINELASGVRKDYFDAMLQKTEDVKVINKQYETLAQDAQITAALETMTKAGRRSRLGPSTIFKNNLTQLEKLASEVLTEDIPIDTSEGVPHVSVTINGNTTREMVLDSGASLVVIPHDLAQELKLIPNDTHQKVRMQMADGKVVEGRLMIVDRIPVGKLRVDNVECAVMPEELVAAQPLLGGSFLSNFTYKVDAASSKLHLIQMDEHKDEAKEDAAKGKAAP